MNSPSSLPSRIHAKVHPSCCAGESAGVTCDVLDAIKREIEETSAHVCSYCAETLPVALDEPTNLATARAHMATCQKHPMRELLEAVRRFVDLSDNEYLGDDPRAVHAVKVARAAIAQAEGR